MSDLKSSLGINYPTYRDRRTEDSWLRGKNVDDGAEGFWRIHDKIYDLTNFIKLHPGGRDWIELTKGTDITEAFEAHHITSKAESILPKYFHKTASSPRNFPFTFHENGFYKTLKRKMLKNFPNLHSKTATRSKVIIDSLLLSYIATFLLAVYFRSFFIGFISGLCLGLTAVAAHNYLHQKNNFRTLYMDLSMISSRNWKISHILSHHMYTNSISDLEISLFEPFFYYLPVHKNWIVRYGSWIYSSIVYSFMALIGYLKQFITILIHESKFSWTIMLPFIVPSLSWIVTGESLKLCFTIFLLVILVSSFYITLVGLNAGHHHPDIFHDGDTPRSKSEMDWGIYQLDAVLDRLEITGSHFLVLTSFGDHALHHLFPTLDHQLLDSLYPIFLETCKEFDLEWKLKSQLESLKGQFKQLARIIPNKNPPGMRVKTL